MITVQTYTTEGNSFEQLRRQRPHNYDLMVRMAEMQISKGHDYTPEGDSAGLGNLLECERFGIPAWLGVLTRMSDKWTRICTFAKKGMYKVKDESFEDTLLDLAIYCLLCILAWRRTKKLIDPNKVAVSSTLCDVMENPGRRGTPNGS